jgi:hypothetical protein
VLAIGSERDRNTAMNSAEMEFESADGAGVALA